MDNLLNSNLDNIQSEFDLFGNKVEKLSIKDRIGFLPISIWQPDWTKVKQLKKIIGDTGQAREMSKHSYNWRSIGWSGPDCPQKISIFNPHLAQMILSAYCPTNAKIYDPFAGGGTRGFIASSMGHEYYGKEIREEEINRIIEQQKILDRQFIIKCADAQDMLTQENYFDFSYTCPPYYNLEIYSEMSTDLSAAKSYNDFLGMLDKVVKSVYYGLKPNCLSIWVVGNFRDKKGNLVYFNGDLINIGLSNGFVLHDEIIFWGASGAANQRAGQFESNRRSVRVHEYIIIFKK